MTQQQAFVSSPVISEADGASSAAQHLSELRSLVRAGRLRWKTLILLEAAGVAVATPLAYLWLVFLLDNLVHLPVWGRLGASLLFVVVIGFLAARLVQSWRRANFTEDQVALAIERRTGVGLDNRLINAIQLGRDERVSSDRLGRAVLEENYRQLKALRLEQTAEVWPAVLRIGMALALIAVGFGFWQVQGERFANAATRIFMPFANIAPIYRTVLSVQPGDITVEPGATVTITIGIEGETPSNVRVLSDLGSEQFSDSVAVAEGASTVSYTFENVTRSLTYAVRANDFTSRYYQITVPVPLDLRRMTAVLTPPAYTGLPGRSIESASGDLEAPRGSKAAIVLTLNQPLAAATLHLNRPVNGLVGASASSALSSSGSADAPAGRTEVVDLNVPADASVFRFEIEVDDLAGYAIQGQRDGQTVSTREFVVRPIDDAPPELRIDGVSPEASVTLDAVLPLSLWGRDDYGLREVGVFYRIVSRPSGSASPGSSASAAGEWVAVRSWGLDTPQVEWTRELSLPVGLMNVAEGETVELALRGKDTDPRKAEVWTTGPAIRLAIGGAGVHLQLLYEQILRSETELRQLITRHESLIEDGTRWLTKLGPTSGLRWDDRKNLDDLAQGMRDLAREQSGLRAQAAEAARQMVTEAGNLKVSVGMLADTEMVRAIRIVERVAQREHPQDMRGTLAEARLTQERIVRSLREIHDRYVTFREEWELEHMLAFTKMLADRQGGMADASLTYIDLADDVIGEAQVNSVTRRQQKLLDLANLAQSAFNGMAGRSESAPEVMLAAFATAAQAFDETGVKGDMASAGDYLREMRWEAAEPLQREASASLLSIWQDIRAAQAELARKVMEDLQNLLESDLEAQKELEKLKEGMVEDVLNINPDDLSIEDLEYYQRLAEQLRNRERDRDNIDREYRFEEELRSALNESMDHPDQTLDGVTLADRALGQKSFPDASDRVPNRVTPPIQENFEDLVGDLIDEADALAEQYETYNLNAAFEINEAGDVSKQSGELNSTAAAAFTGNQKPPTQNFGGASRAGRQGARAHGMTVGDESINRQGRDEVQEGQDEVADQDGVMSETMSDDPQEDASTGVGGKVVGKDQTSFSTKDAGEWKDEMVERLREPQPEHQIVERKGKPMDHRVAQQMYDTESQQEQVIKRIKAIKKELDALFLPTDHLDDIMEQLVANLEKLKEAPDRDVFRQQIELLDRLKGTVVVFNRPSSEFQQTLQRDQQIRGRILDESASPSLPGYEEAVSRYYEKLSGL